MDLRAILENQIHLHIYSENKDVTAIVMHPRTWEKLVTEVMGIGSGAINYHNVKAPMTYRGITVYRTLDIEMDKFGIH